MGTITREGWHGLSPITPFLRYDRLKVQNLNCYATVLVNAPFRFVRQTDTLSQRSPAHDLGSCAPVVEGCASMVGRLSRRFGYCRFRNGGLLATASIDRNASSVSKRRGPYRSRCCDRQHRG